MYRSWGLQTLTGAAQPLFNDKLTAAFAIPPSHIDPILTVANTAKYQQGERITLDPGQADADIVLVTNILTGTTLQVSSQGAVLHAHAINTVICLNIPCGGLIIFEPATDAGAIWVGSDNTVTNVGGGSAFYQITQGGNYPIGAYQWNAERTTDLWIAGTAADTVGVAAYVV